MLSIDAWWFDLVFLAVWSGWLASVVWQAYRDNNQTERTRAAGVKAPRWTRTQGWIVGLGTVFVALTSLSRLSGSSDTAFLTGWIWTIGTVAVFGWVLTAVVAFAILLWRLGLFIRALWRAARPS